MTSDTKVGISLGIIFVSTIILIGVFMSTTTKAGFKMPSSGNNEKIEAFTLGQESRTSGVTDCANPYIYPYLRKPWLQGWISADPNKEN